MRGIMTKMRLEECGERGLILLYRESCFGRALFAMKGSVYTLIRA